MFRLKRETFEYILNIISNDLTRETIGNETIPSRKQLMIALWKMATMDSYRYDYCFYCIYYIFF